MSELSGGDRKLRSPEQVKEALRSCAGSTINSLIRHE
jgi:hypothetical protein